MRNKLKQINEDFKLLESNYNQISRSNETNVNQLQLEIKKNSNLNKEIATLKSDNNKNIQEINQQGERMNSLRSTNKDYEKTITMLQSALNSNNDCNTSDKNKVGKLNSYIQHLQNKLQNVEKNESSLIAANKKLIESNENNNKTTHQLLQDKDRIIQSLNIKLREKELIVKKYNKKDSTEVSTNLNS